MPASRRTLIAAACLALAGAGAGCTGQAALGLLPGVVNDPHNHSLRRALLAQGMTSVCDELRARSLPLRFRDEDPAIGRFFVTACSSPERPNGDVQIQFGGLGYVWTNLSLRIAFEASSAIEYDIDFLLEGSTMYVYLRPRATAPPTFKARFVENSQVLALAGMFGVGPGMINGIGRQIMEAQLGHGFTLIRDESGTVELAPGVVPRGLRPTEAFTGLDRSKRALVNERSQVQSNQRDFLGPFDVPAGKRLGVYVNVEGAPGVEVVVMPQVAGDPWLLTYASQAATTPPPAAPLLDEVAATGAIYYRSVAVPPGSYYLVLDNTRAPGRPPPASAVVSSAAVLE